MTIERFEDIIAWQKAKGLTVKVYSLFSESKNLNKITENNFGIEKVVFVGDKGMIKKQQIENLLSDEFKWNYITSITKTQINNLITKGVIQLSLFDTELVEVEDNGIRYVLRKNPLRQEEIAGNRAQKIEKVQQEAKNRNTYLKDRHYLVTTESICRLRHK